ncbi:MAG: YegP family protein [Kiritimatiellae bacterium]|nr:YegP family protein [Kiritimatiellia bacterium]MBP5320391.1 YegP family protein [Kiritimatiellia bacterium]
MGKFLVQNAKTGVKFNLLAANGQVIATSQIYASLRACKKGVASVQKNAPAAVLEDQTVEGFKSEKCPKFEVYKDKAGEFRFRLKATNGQIIAVGEGYTSLKSCLNGVDSVKKNAVDATIVAEAK